MAQLFEESLFQAIKNDDKKAFDALNEKARCGEYRMGRFPVPSLLYLYKSKKILSAYEEAFLKITDYTELREPAEVSKKFSAAAGKCLRLYLDEAVSPLEMLLILDKVRRLKRVYPLTKPSAQVKGRLKSIYNVRYSLEVKFEGDNIIIDRRPLSYREKKNIATACLCSALAVTLAVGVPVTAVTLIPKPVEGEVTKLSQIDFASGKEYTLKNDLVLPENYSVEKVNCRINGGGHTLSIGGGVSLGELNGKLSDLTIESEGAVFASVSETAKIEDITVNVTAAQASAEGTALLAVNNYGTIDGVTVNVSGRLEAVASGKSDELTFGGIVRNNNYKLIASSQTVYRGVIKNCTVNYSQFSLSGEASANAAFGGVAGVNFGYLQNCTVTGEIDADTFDIAGVCVVNNGMLSGSVNEAKLSQTSADAGWNPIVCGIVLNNAYAAEKCVNRGRISAVSEVGGETAPVVSAAGIAYIANYTVAGCTNSGAVSAKGAGEVYAGGIAARSCARLYNCFSEGEISVTGNSVYAGGIMGYSEVYYEADFFGYNFAWGEAAGCISENKITVALTGGNTPAYIGGIVGFIKETGINNGGKTTYFGGGVTGCYFTGVCVFEGAYSGNIVGVCGANIYESNSYTSGFTEYRNFENNFYAADNLTAFGAALTENGEYVTAADKGAEAASVEGIRNSEGYKSILNALK